MKSLFIKAKNLFSSLLASPNSDPVLRKMDKAIETMLIVIFASIILLVCCSCGSTKAVTQLVERTSVDTVYLSNTQYDSIFIYKDKLTDRSRDTIYVKDVSVEYRYKMLRDTIYKTQVDSIPYQVTVTEVKEITRPLTWFDHLTRACFWICIGGLLILLYKFIKYFRSGGLLNN